MPLAGNDGTGIEHSITRPGPKTKPRYLSVLLDPNDIPEGRLMRSLDGKRILSEDGYTNCAVRSLAISESVANINSSIQRSLQQQRPRPQSSHEVSESIESFWRKMGKSMSSMCCCARCQGLGRECSLPTSRAGITVPRFRHLLAALHGFIVEGGLLIALSRSGSLAYLTAHMLPRAFLPSSNKPRLDHRACTT